MGAELVRPGVSVLQKFRTASPSFVRPTLAPCVVGPAFEVINVLTSDGTVNEKAKYGVYRQLGTTIPQTAFPDHRGNIDELSVLEETIRPFMLAGGSLAELPMAPGAAFLAAVHTSSRAALRSAAFGAGLALGGKVLVFALDQPVAASRTKDITVTFTGGVLTAAQAAAQINTAVGSEVATVVETDVLQLASSTYGALSSVTVRSGASANALLALGYDAGAQREERIEGSGFRGQEDNNNDTTTPWVEFHKGAFLVNGASVAIVAKAGLINVETKTFASALAADVAFTGAGSLDLKAGDLFFADGLQVAGSAEVMKVEASRFKLGTINTSLSVANEKGQYTKKVYDTAEVSTLFAADPFAPQFVYFRATGLNHRKLAPVAASLEGTAEATPATAATLAGTGAVAGPFELAGLYLDYVVTVDGEETEGRFTFTGGAANMDAVAAAIGTNIPGVVAVGDGAVPEQLILSTVKTGRNQALTIKDTSTAAALLGVDGLSETGTDASIATLATKALSFRLNKSAHIYTAIFTSDSLDLAVEEINAVAGAPVASKSADGLSLVLTSTLKGVASHVEALTSTALTLLGMDVTSTATGTGRPLPEAYLDDTGSLVLAPELLRDQVTGYPLDQALNNGTLYVQFKALRKDVTAVAKDAGVLAIPDPDTLEAVLDPVSEENPLALGLFLAMANAPTYEVKGLGVDEVTAAAPEGTVLAYARAAALLETEEVYALAPLTSDETVTALFRFHALAMSEPEQAGERIVFFNHKMPTRKNSTVAASGTQAGSTATPNQLLLDTNPAGGLVKAGLNPALPFTANQGVYVEIEVAGELRRYSVVNVTGALANLRTAFAAGENTDGFYSTATLDVPVVNAAWSLKVRGASLTIPGSDRLDYAKVADTVSEANFGIKNRRAYSVFPDAVTATINGVEKTLPGYYACAAIVGMVAALPPQQGFTNYPMAAITSASGTEKFSKKQLNIMAGGGTYILAQDVENGPVFSRHQVSTDLTSIEFRELSITKVVDFVAKFLRVGVRKFIGTQVINEQLLDTIGTTLQGMLGFLVEAGVLNGAEVNNIAQDIQARDTILVDVVLDVPYPCNYIRLTLVA